MKETDEQHALTAAAGELKLVLHDTGYEAQRQRLIESVNDLLANNFDKLVSILYRMDINEARLRNLLRESQGENAAELIATLMLERELQKIRSRREHRRDDHTIDEQEKW